MPKPDITEASPITEEATMEQQEFRFRRVKNPDLVILTVSTGILSVFVLVRWIEILRVSDAEPAAILAFAVLCGMLFCLWRYIRYGMDVIAVDCHNLRVCRGKNQLWLMDVRQVKTVVYSPGQHRYSNAMLGITALSTDEIIQKELEIQNRSPLNPSGLTLERLSPGVRTQFLLSHVVRQRRRIFRADQPFVWMDYSPCREKQLREIFPDAEWFGVRE